MNTELKFEDGTSFSGFHFGYKGSVAGELVFNTGMVGYPETMTDPSYTGQIVTFTYPMIGNYGIADQKVESELLKFFESNKIFLKGIVINSLSPIGSHWQFSQTLEQWMIEHKVAGMHNVDTRAITKKLRDEGTTLATLIYENQNIAFYDPNKENLVEQVSIKEPILYNEGGDKTVVLIDTGCKFNIIRSLLKRKVKVLRVPWDYDFRNDKYDGILISNGPGDPSQVNETIKIIQKCFGDTKPIFGICLGNQLVAKAAGAETYKLKFGHRSQNQPCIKIGTKKCYITSQNHGYAVAKETLNNDWEPFFFNANDGTNEGIRHKQKKIFTVQFHPEASPGPIDTQFLFDDFIQLL